MEKAQSSLDDFRSKWIEKFKQLSNFGFSKEESEFAIEWEGKIETSQIEVQFSPKAYRAINRAAHDESRMMDDFFSLEPQIVNKKTVIRVSHLQLATLHYIVMLLLIPKLETEKNRRVTKNKKEITHLVRCMLKDGPSIWIGKIHYSKGEYIIPYAIKKKPKEKAAGRSVNEVIQNFQEILDQLPS